MDFLKFRGMGKDCQRARTHPKIQIAHRARKSSLEYHDLHLGTMVGINDEREAMCVPLNFMGSPVTHPALIIGTTLVLTAVFGLLTKWAWKYLQDPDEKAGKKV